MTPSRLLTTKEFALRAGVTAETVRNWKYQGRIRPAKRRNGRDLLWAESELEKVLSDDVDDFTAVEAPHRKEHPHGT